MQPFKRKVFYLGGFDPRGARFYHELLAQQVAAHNADVAEEAHLELGPRRRLGANSAWSLESAAGDVSGEHEFLMWDDLVRKHWLSNPWSLFRHACVAYAHFVARLDRALMPAVPRGSLVALYYPGATFVLLPLVLALLGWLGLRVFVADWLSLVVAAAFGVGVAWLLLRKIHSLWLLRFVIFNDQLARRAVDPAVWDRIEAFAQRLNAALDEGWDEVLFISHSNGTVMAMPVMARLLALREGQIPAHFAQVTLGGCVQLLAGRRDAAWFAGVLDEIGQGGWLWLDLGSPTDGACVPLVDPCLGRPVPRPAGLEQLSPRWFRYCDGESYAARRSDKYLIHFDYLRRLNRPSSLDYLGLVAVSRPLSASIAAFKAENPA